MAFLNVQFGKTDRHGILPCAVSQAVYFCIKKTI
jgi:hypothetical protein